VLGPASLPDAGRCSVSGVRLRLGPNVDACSKPARVAERALACLCGVHPDSLPAGPKKDWTGKHPYLTVAHSILRHLHSNVVRPGRLCDARRGRDCVSLAHGCMTCNVAHREPRFGTEIAHAADFADGGLFLDDFDAVLDMGRRGLQGAARHDEIGQSPTSALGHVRPGNAQLEPSSLAVATTCALDSDCSQIHRTFWSTQIPSPRTRSVAPSG